MSHVSCECQHQQESHRKRVNESSREDGFMSRGKSLKNREDQRETKRSTVIEGRDWGRERNKRLSIVIKLLVRSHIQRSGQHQRNEGKPTL